MQYLYHRVPKNLQGDTLYPLNILKEKHPDIYKEEAGKYIGREHIMQQKIPTLNCLWNDVLHFTAVHPEEIKKALIEAGKELGFPMDYYQIDPEFIKPENAVVYLYAHTSNESKMNRENFVLYDPDDMVKYSIMPEGTKDYYKEMISKGQRPLLYHLMPHILYRSSLDVADMSVISV